MDGSATARVDYGSEEAAMQAYLRMSVVNRIRDEIRRVSRRPETVEMTTEPIFHVMP